MTASHPCRYDGIVLGAGVAGNTAAIALALQGRRIAIVEKAVFPRRKVCGEFLSATSVPVLDALGVGSAWRDRAGPDVRRVCLYAGERIVEAPMPHGDEATHGRALGRDVLDTMMLSRACELGVDVWQPYKARYLARVGYDFEVTITGGTEEHCLTAPVIVAAHGSWDRGTLPTNLPRQHAPGDLLGFKAYFRNASLPADMMPLIAFPGGYGGMVWADDGRLSISCCIRRDRLDALRARGGTSAAEAMHRHVIESTAGVRRAIGQANLDGLWLSTGPIRPGIRARHADGIFRVGNVAGESHPIIAEGQAMAIQSAWLLAKTLAGADFSDPSDLHTAGQRYGQAWRRQFTMRIRAAAAFSYLAMRPGAFGIAGAVVEAMPGILTLGARLSGKTRTVGRI